MVRVSNGFKRHKRHKKFLQQAKGFRGSRNKVYKLARLALTKQGQNAYIGRKHKKRDFRTLWIERISASVRAKGGKYSILINSMYKKNIKLNRKVLSNIALVFPQVFDNMYQQIMN